ncbi:PREDICTED: myb-like protein X [Nicotiana attenuata]|uniref:Uncharacterized protein n=1 Tax=Nicotiana attenuata TaxID=49451 RepID=A0A1J6HZD7_NICAT|nr:PREDICTED: myb-like protein X [Nicotiana attenuata]XP_019254387.1 PREDICTED: myb-like protein X [Nicotiana attenuata]OIS97697.1 hypothetical protein A4A49_07662 [Nicotiana attenuata]
MYKQSPSRNHRSKGIKLKHVLQICLLLAVCFWLIYQVKHSHDKKKEFDENDAKFPIKTESSNEPVKFGRKDLQPRIEGFDTVNEKHKDEPEDETVEDEEGNKPEEEDLEEENKIKEKNVEHTEDGEDEVNDHDQEKSDVEVDQEEDIVDEDKERGEDDEKETEERDPEVNDSQMEEENLLEDHDHDEDSSSSHEAREEHYKADDASSAVTHDTVITTTENDSGKIEKEAEHAAEVTSEVGVNNSMQINTGQNTTADVKADGEGSPPNTTNSEEKHDDPISSTATDASVSNSTITEGLTDNSGSRTHSTEVSTQMHDISLQNGTQAVTQEYNATVEDTTSGGSSLSISSSQQRSNPTDMADNQLVSNLSFSSKNDGVDSTPVDSLNVSGDTESSLAEKVIRGNATVEAVDNNVTEVENTDTSDENGTTDEGVDASISENLGEVQDDPIDTSDSSTHLEEKHIRTDLETLPEIQTEGNMEDAAAE